MVSSTRIRANKRSLTGFVGRYSGLPVKPANTVAPAITGTAQVGQTLAVTNGTWTGRHTPTYTRQWRAAGVAIAGATGATYQPMVGDVGKAITVVVTARNSAGVTTATSNATAAVIAA